MIEAEKNGISELSKKEQLDTEGGLLGIFVSMAIAGYSYERYLDTGKLFIWQ